MRLAALLILLLYNSSVQANFVRYGGFMIGTEKKTKIKNFTKFTWKTNVTCLSIIEVNPYIMKRVNYTKEEFSALIDHKDAIAQHLSKQLDINILKFVRYLRRNSDEVQYSNDCVSIKDLINFNNDLKRESQKLKSVIDQIILKKHAYIALLKSKFILPVYISGDVFDKYVIRKDPDLMRDYDNSWKNGNSIESVRKILDINKYLHNVFIYLKRYNKLDRVEGESRQEIMNLKKSKKNKDSLLKKLELHEMRKASYNNKLKKHLKATEILDFPIVPYQNKQMKAGTRSLKKEYLAHLKTMEKNLSKKIFKLHIEHQVALKRIADKMQDRDTLIKDFQNLKQRRINGDMDLVSYQKYKDLKSEIKFGIKPKVRNSKGLLYKYIKKYLMFYNIYATDTIVDKFMDSGGYQWNMKQMQPLSKKNYLHYRLAKAGDGLFVLSTSIVGLALVPFTGGLSFLLANLVNVVTTDFFSCLVSYTRNEPLDSNFYRLGLRGVHAFVEGIFVPLATFNGFFTAIDDLRVATGVDQWIESSIKNKKYPMKVRPEALGRPVVLSLLRERYNYLAYGLIPTGKALLMFQDLNKEQMKFLYDYMVKIEKAKHTLRLSMTRAAMRYESLLLAGKIPDHLIFDVSKNLKEYYKAQKYFNKKEYLEKNIINSIFIKLPKQT